MTPPDGAYPFLKEIPMDSGPSLWISEIVFYVFRMSPFFLVYLLGLVLALSRWSRHPQVCGLVLLAIGLSLFTDVGSFLFWRFVMSEFGHATELDHITISRVIGFVTNVGHAAAMGLLLLAAFASRPRDYFSRRPEPRGENLPTVLPAGRPDAFRQ